MHASDADTSSKVKLYSAGIEVCCRNNADKEALELLQELADQTGHSGRNSSQLLPSSFLPLRGKWRRDGASAAGANVRFDGGFELDGASASRLLAIAKKC